MTQRSQAFRRPLRRLVLASTLVLVPSACKSADAYRDDADREVYEIIRSRRDEFAALDGFTIEPSPENLRVRILEGAAASDVENPLLLTLLDALEIAGENSRDYQDQRESLYLTALDLTLERWQFSVKETGTFGAFLDGDFVEGQGWEAQGAGLLSGFGLTKLLGSGARIAGNVGLDLVRDVSRGDGWDALSNLSLNITQPLLRGFGRDIVLEPLTQADRNLVYEVRAYERFRRTFAFNVASQYYRVLQQGDTLENEERNYQRLIELRERNESLAEAGRQSDIQVDQARQDELRAATRLVDVRSSYASALDDFKLFLGLPIEASILLDREEFQRLRDAGFTNADVGSEAAYAIAQEERLDFLNTLGRYEDAGRRVKISADGLRTRLDVGAGLGPAQSDEGRPLDWKDGGIGWSTDLEIDLAIDRLPERNAYRASLVRLEAARRTVEEAADVILRDLRNDERDVRSAEESYEIQIGAVTLAQRRVESAQLNLEAGRANTRDLLEAQEDLLEAENAATQALVDYTLARLAFLLDMGVLRVEQQGFEVEAEPLRRYQENQP